MAERFVASEDACRFAVYDCGAHLTGLVSRCKNYWIRHTTLRAPKPIRWVNTSLALVRRKDFDVAGPFREVFHVRYGGTDVFFGRRLAATCGPIGVDAETELTHLKTFTLAKLLKNDFRRSRGWLRLALSTRGMRSVARAPRMANVRRRFSLGVLATGAAMGCGVLTPFAPLVFGPLTLALLGAELLSHADVIRGAASERVRGWPLFPFILLADHVACAAGLALALVSWPFQDPVAERETRDAFDRHGPPARDL